MKHELRCELAYVFNGIASASLGKTYLSKVFLKHIINTKRSSLWDCFNAWTRYCSWKKKEFSKLIGKKYLNKTLFPFSKNGKINFNSKRQGNIIGEHEVIFSSGKEKIALNHYAFNRALFSEGALTAAKWLFKKKPGLYSMRDLLNFK